MRMEERQNRSLRKGFTLIELSLSIAFIGILSITIALIINDTIATYRRGLTLNQINTTGMDLVDDMRAAIQNSSSRGAVGECATWFSGNDLSNCEDDGGLKMVSVTREATVNIKGRTESDNKAVPVLGAFCTGTYSYIWNSGYFFGENGDYEVNGAEQATFKYKDAAGGESTIEGFRLLKIKDNTRVVCVSQLGSSGGNRSYELSTEKISEFNISGMSEIVDEEPVSLISAEGNSDSNLALYDLTAAKPASSNASNSAFYAVSFILGTIQGGVDVLATGNFCATPNDYEVANFDYCAINKFNFAAQATGE